MASPAVSLYSAASPAPGALPTPWIEYKTPEGTPYYYNPQSQVTQWERPVATPAPVPAPTPPVVKSPVSAAAGVGAGIKAASPVGSIRGELSPTHSVTDSVHSAAHSRAPSAATHTFATAASPHMMQQLQQHMNSGMMAASPHQAAAYAKTPSPLPQAHYQHPQQYAAPVQAEAQQGQQEPQEPGPIIGQEEAGSAADMGGYAAYGQQPYEGYAPHQEEPQHQQHFSFGATQASAQGLEGSASASAPTLEQEQEGTLGTTAAVAGTTISASGLSAPVDGWGEDGEDDALFGGEGEQPRAVSAASAQHQQEQEQEQEKQAFQPQPQAEQRAELFGGEAAPADAHAHAHGASPFGAPAEQQVDAYGQQMQAADACGHGQQMQAADASGYGQQQVQATDASDYGGYTGFDITPAPEVAAAYPEPEPEPEPAQQEEQPQAYSGFEPAAEEGGYSEQQAHQQYQPYQHQQEPAQAYTGFDMGAYESAAPAPAPEAEAEPVAPEMAAYAPPQQPAAPQQAEEQAWEWDEQQSQKASTPQHPLEPEPEPAAVAEAEEEPAPQQQLPTPEPEPEPVQEEAVQPQAEPDPEVRAVSVSPAAAVPPMHVMSPANPFAVSPVPGALAPPAVAHKAPSPFRHEEPEQPVAVAAAPEQAAWEVAASTPAPIPVVAEEGSVEARLAAIEKQLAAIIQHFGIQV